MSLTVNDSLLAGRYRLLETVGTGGMAEVYRAEDTVLGREVAVKVFRSGGDDTARHRFKAEVRTLAALSHPGLVPVHDACTGDDMPFLVMRLVEGRTLRAEIADGPLSAQRVRRLGTDLAEALAYVHAQGVVHRDIKPSNILLDAHGRPYLADFGLAHLPGATRLTRADEMVGTAAYLAPEQVRGTDVDYPADIYALGLVLLECLTGRREYPGSEVEAAVARLHRSPAIPEDLPIDLVGLLSSMTDSVPDQRPTAVDCARALQARHADDTRPTSAHVAETAPVAAARVPRKALLVSAAALVGAVSVAWAIAPGAQPVNSAPTSSTPPSTTSSSTAAPASTAPSQAAVPVTTPSQQPVAQVGAVTQADTAAPVPAVPEVAQQPPAQAPAAEAGEKKQKDKAQPPGKSKK